MADYISQITLPDENTYDLKDAAAAHGNGRIFYGTCSTAAGTVPKEVICNNYDTLTIGDILIVKFTNTNSAAVNDNLKLQITNSSGSTTEAKSIKQQYNSTGNNNLNVADQLNSDGISTFVYSGTYWILLNGNYNNTYSYMRPYGSTASDVAAKIGSAGWKFQLSAGKYFMFTQYYDNTAQSALTLNIGSTGAKPIYINDEPSSVNNYTLPGGQYLVYYDGTNYHFRTDGKLPGDIAGNARSLETAREIYVDLTTTRPDNPNNIVSYNKVLFDGTSDIVLHVNGILPLIHGGTGASSINKYGIIYGNSTQDAYTSTTYGTEGMVVVGHGQNNAPDWYPGLLLTSSGTPVTYSAAFSGSVTINSTLDVTGNTTIGNSTTASTLDVYGATTLHNILDVTGAATLNSTSQLIGNVGIGGAPDTGTGAHILKIIGSTLISTSNNDIAHLDISTNQNNTELEFYPESNDRGFIGLVNHRWKEGHFSQLIDIIDNTNLNSIKLNVKKIDNVNYSSLQIDANNQSTSQILLETKNTAGAPESKITLKSKIPTIILDTITTNASDWIITNTDGIFSLNNQASNNKTELKGTNDGFKLTQHVGIGTEPEQITETNTDPHVLVINGSTLVTSSQTEIMHLDVITENSNIIPQLYPNTTHKGYIGKESNRWQYGYFSDTINIGDVNNSNVYGVNISGDGTVTIQSGSNNIITLETDNTSNTPVGQITIKSVQPTIKLETTSISTTTNTLEEYWTIKNINGNFELTNSAVSPKQVQINGSDNGWQLNGQIGINIAPESWPTQSSTDPHILVINGSTLIKDDSENAAHLDLSTETINNNNHSTINFYPETSGTGQLGLGGNNSKRWGKIYLGDADTYGDEYTPIYWNNGVPHMVPVVQKYEFTISLNTATISLDNTYSDSAIVNSIVITGGLSYLNAPLVWNIDINNHQITISSKEGNNLVNVSDDVSGYILVSTGIDLSLASGS